MAALIPALIKFLMSRRGGGGGGGGGRAPKSDAQRDNEYWDKKLYTPMDYSGFTTGYGDGAPRPMSYEEMEKSVTSGDPLGLRPIQESLPGGKRKR